MANGRKIAKKVKRRENNYHPTGANPKHVAHKPGSQNLNNK